MLPLSKAAICADDFDCENEKDLSFWRKTLQKLSDRKLSWEHVLEAAEGPLNLHPLSRLATEREGRTLLHLAVLHNHPAVISDLKGTLSLNLRRDAFGLTPLELAQFLHRDESIQILQPSSKIPFSKQPHVSIPDSDKEKFIELEYLPWPIFETQKGLDDILAKTKKGKLDDQIPPEKIWMGIYFDKEIQKGIHPPVSIRYIDDELGYGVFAEQRIPPCAFAGEYTGVVQERKKKHLKDKYYCLRYTVWEMGSRNFVLDAEKMGNFTRFINHSAQPNLGVQSVYWRGLPRMIFIALKEIQPGTQLTFDYGSFFWKECPQTPKLLV